MYRSEFTSFMYCTNVGSMHILVTGQSLFQIGLHVHVQITDGVILGSLAGSTLEFFIKETTPEHTFIQCSCSTCMYIYVCLIHVRFCFHV